MMIRCRWYAVLLILPLLAVLRISASAAEPAAWSPAAAVSPDAFVVLEVHKPRAVLDRLFDPRVVQAVTSHPEYQRRQAQQDFAQAKNLVQYFEQRFNTDLHGLLGKLAGGGVTLAVGPDQQALLIVEAEDAQVLKDVHDFILFIARSEAEKQGQPDRVKSAEYRGVTGWSVAPKEAHAILGNRLLLTNHPQSLMAAVDRIQDSSQPNLASLPRYQQAHQAFAQPPVASVFARMDVLKQLPKVQAALDQESNPLATLLLAPLMQTLQHAEWLAMGLDVDGMTFSLRLATDGRPVDASEPAGFARSAEPAGGALPNLSVPGQIAAVSLYRDLHQFYAAKDDLFPQRTSGLIFFENMMGIFFTGRDLTNEVLAELTPEVRLVVAAQQYPAEVGTPQPQLPGFALVVRMRRPEKFSLVAEEAWQKALGLINFTRGQQAEPGLILDRPTHGDVKYTMSYFAPPAEDARAPSDLRFNFQPVLAMPGDYLILSSTDALAKDLMDALNREADAGAVALAGKHSLVELNGDALTALLQANREALIRQNMVEKGHTREQAEIEIGMLLTIVDSIAHVKLVAGDEAARQLSIELKLNIQP
ncbi:MAG: DUF3352 domain-containing protein [Pirellulaceae bacterium]|nr:DUF3352 domain-containing protein [Pirellulaceae bacterium]